jgi:EAL domain-containing protein (putative c-di-GMP-specific phosphodiesterase class I)
VRLAASVGIALADDATTPGSRELLRNADVALYLAKSRGKGRVERYERGMQAAVFERLELKADLAHAVSSALDQFEVLYQPIVDLPTGRTTGVEALLRWRNPVRGMVPPTAFIPLAEETGLICPLGRHVLRVAVEQLSTWRAHGFADLELHVNVATPQLEDPGFIDDVVRTLTAAGVEPASLTLELTESVLAGERHNGTLEALRAIGVKLAIDDFGTGYASFGYLARLPAQVIKLDRSFVSTIDERQTAEVVRAILELARFRGLEVVAEGIEQAHQADALQALGCTVGQGWLYAPALAPAAVEERLAAQVGASAATVG